MFLIDLFQNNKQFSDHKPIETIIELSQIETFTVTKYTFCLQENQLGDHKKSIEQKPFLPFFYSNDEELLLQ